MVALGAIGGASLVLAACGGGGSTPASHAPSTPSTGRPAQPAGGPQQGGTVYWSEPVGSAPNYIFPMVSFAQDSAANVAQFQQLLYRPLYWFGTKASPTVDYAKSIGRPPLWSNGNQTVTITLQHYVWSDAEAVSARDVVFWINMLKAEKANWPDYTAGLFPDNVTSVTMPDGPTGSTVRLDLTRSFNPTWFLSNELSQITPLPLAWDRTGAAGKVPTATGAALPDATPAGAAKVYAYLTGAARNRATYASSPLWSIVDGPWKLIGLEPSGRATFVPNPDFAGPGRPYLSKFVELPFSSDTAEYEAISSGSSAVQVGYVPLRYLLQLRSVEANGYRALTSYRFGVNFMAINFASTGAGKLFAQLYVRQALERLINQTRWTDAYFAKVASPTYGPVPIQPSSSLADGVERSRPYPFDVASAEALLSAHGWTVKPGGTTTCTVAVRCGPGITTGQALVLHVDYASGSTPLAMSMQDFQAAAAQAGVRVTASARTFDDVINEARPTSKTWEIANWGGGAIYSPNYYPSGEQLFASGAGENSGGFADPTADKLITTTLTAGAPESQSALDAYQDYIARQLPVLWEPLPGTERVVATGLGGTVLEPNAFDNLDPESWYFQRK